ncbi:PREDICTED: uncharacterized protein LOC105457721 [Wasmannia auropunctata]|uniref:uncharacterized protein LOC105457721 n=1 Tax=Wasmannia auropunctata TaxID=64793 RepID=UPI0005EDFA8F|nr:PREDICTED: uncharacterized protein LOC105457721 [Wasmannia auropunctata]
MIYIRVGANRSVKCRALLDTGATANFISERIVKQLNAPVIPHATPVGAINAMHTYSKGMVRITVQSMRNDFHKEIACLIMPTITDLVPSEAFPRSSIKVPPNVKLADPEFHLPRPIDLLIGSGATLSLFSIGQINLSHEGHDLYLQKTRLGWVVAGSAALHNPTGTGACYLTKLESQLENFWTIEEVAADKSNPGKDNDCEAHFIRNTRREDDGRYTVRLPFRETNKRIGESRTIAFKRFLALEQKFNANETFKIDYSRAMEEYIRLKHISVIEDPADDDGYYLPHHAVVKDSSTTTKVRIVFDASAKANNGVSLNDVLMVGPIIQDKLFSHLIRFRMYKYVVTADIEKMYLQILLHEDDRRYQRILWRKDGEVQTFQFNTLTFGVSSSSFLAIRTLQKLADDERHVYPRAAEIIKAHLYVDDLLTGADSVEEARAYRDEIIALLARGGFAIRKWASNDERVVNDLPVSALHTDFTFDGDLSLKTLGVTWHARNDEVRYFARHIKIPKKLTKRNILSEIAKIYDPLGLLGPLVLHAKKIMQDVWRCRLDWDESVPQNIYTEWLDFVNQFELINQISVSRKLLVEDACDIQIHGFCDASSIGYGACLYVLSTDRRGNTVVRLLCAKSRVAPLKPVTIPRLELCGALLLARLYFEVSGALRVMPTRTFFWCDSTVVLHWLNTSPHLLNSFVANRVAEIQKLTTSCEWRHVKSEDNPADALSRGQLPRAFIRNLMWFAGPAWLCQGGSEWPKEFVRTSEVLELRKNVCLAATSGDPGMFDGYSSYSKTLRIVAYCLRFRHPNKRVGPLCAKEIDEAETRILKIVQNAQFPSEIKGLTNENPTIKGKIANLSPFIDSDGLIRVGGRIQKSELAFSRKHPILLPSRHNLTDRIIHETHERHHHAGIQTTLYILRQKYWLIDGRNQVRKIVRACVKCFRFDASAVEYKMGSLPAARVREAVPFTNTGVDFCGPFFIKEKKHRNRARVKVYVCVFVCMAIKAVHLEIVSDLSSDGFLAALRRFVARRGLPAHVYSDNGTNFVGANNQLKELYALLNSEEHQNLVNRFANERRIVWHFIPPVAPHFGGLWESTVKLFKHHFKRVVGDLLFTFEELNTFVVEVEGILNSRPIVTLSSDPNDLLVLSPAHYLIGKPLTTLPEGDLSCVPANRLSTWQHISKVRQDFWARWSLEYLNELQTRTKWVKDGPKLDVGTVVLIKDKNLPCNQWALGRVTEVQPGEDGIVRAASVKTSTGQLTRAARYLCPLPIER